MLSAGRSRQSLTSGHASSQPSSSHRQSLDTKDGSVLAGKRKKRRGSKTQPITTKDTASEKVDLAADQLRQNLGLYDHFLERMDKWLFQNRRKVLSVMKKFDRDQEGLVTYDEFKSAMFDIDAPCNAVELHLLCKILDIYCEKDIDYTMLHDGLGCIRRSEEGTSPDVRRSIESTLSLFTAEPEVNHLVQWKEKKYTTDAPRYAMVNFRLVTFAKDKTHSSHISEMVEVTTNGLALAEIIRQKTQTSATARQFKLYFGHQCTPDQLFPANSNLWQHGCLGGTRSQPEQVLLYYNFTTMFKDCPILMCDYYINLITPRNRNMLLARRQSGLQSRPLLLAASVAPKSISERNEGNN
ncbi:hypothetical protein LSAT2_026228 [Lamellibrachia satsuma]|nr:hypothetical protein LSAT2_026228 [Lamellibrachia satsuma]